MVDDANCLTLEDNGSRFCRNVGNHASDENHKPKVRIPRLKTARILRMPGMMSRHNIHALFHGNFHGSFLYSQSNPSGLCCVICKVLDCFFRLACHLTENTFCLNYKALSPTFMSTTQ